MLDTMYDHASSSHPGINERGSGGGGSSGGGATTSSASTTTGGDFGSTNDHLDALLADYNNTTHQLKGSLEHELYNPTYGGDGDSDMFSYLATTMPGGGGGGVGVGGTGMADYASMHGYSDSSFGSSMSTTSSLSNVGSPQYLSSNASVGTGAGGGYGTTAVSSQQGAGVVNRNPAGAAGLSFESTSPNSSGSSPPPFSMAQYHPTALDGMSIDPTSNIAYPTMSAMQFAQQQQQQLVAAHLRAHQQHQQQQQPQQHAGVGIGATMGTDHSASNVAPPYIPHGASYGNAAYTPSPTNSTSSQGQPMASSYGLASPDEAALARMIANQQRQIDATAQQQQQQQQQAIAHAQAQAQAQAQSAYHQSYVSTMAQQQQQSLAQSYGNHAAAQSALFEPSRGVEVKKARRPSMNDGGAKARSTVAASAGGRKHLAPAASTEGAKKISSAFQFALKPEVVSAAATVQYGSDEVVDLIANAGTASMRRVSSVETPLGAKASTVKAGSTKDVKSETNDKSDDDKNADASSGKKKKGEKGDKGHNAVERRYRNNINNHLSALRDQIPALRHLKPLPSMPASRRRASQFTLTTGSQLPTPAGLIDGIPAAKTLSKGTILGKAIEYIHYLQHARSDGQEDVEMFKQFVLEMVGGGQALIDVFEQRRAVREEERTLLREQEREEQEAMDEEDEAGSGDDEAEEVEDKKPAVTANKVKPTATKKGANKRESPTAPAPRPAPAQAQNQAPTTAPSSVLGNLAQVRQQLTSGHAQDYDFASSQSSMHPTMLSTSSPDNAFPPSPVSSSEGLSISPRLIQGYSPTNFRGAQIGNAGPPRVLLASFLGLSFAGGLGYDWTYSSSPVAQDSAPARAWAGRLVGRSPPNDLQGASASSFISSDVLHPSLLTGLVFMGIGSIIAIVLFVLYPLIVRPKSTPAVLAATEGVKSRSAYRQRRRAQALASLARLTESSSRSSGPTSYEAECRAALAARKQLLKLVGAPTFGLLPALAKESLATLLRKVTTIRVGSFARWSEEERVEAAVAWVRIAEIEATVGADDVNYLARCYTFLRLFNLSHSASWPETTSSTNRASVNAILSVHLLSLGQPLSAYALWTKATRHAERSRKKTDAKLHPWVEIALATEWTQVRQILRTQEPIEGRVSSPSDTSPLMRVAERRCHDALLEAWGKIFVGVVATTCPPPPASSTFAVERFAELVDQPFLEETVAHVLESTVSGSSVHSMGRVTRALCAYYGGEVEIAMELREQLRREYEADGPARRIESIKMFFQLVPSLHAEAPFSPSSSPSVSSEEAEEGSEVESVSSKETSRDQVDHLASVTLGWLLIRRRLVSSKINTSLKADPTLHHDALSLRRQLGVATILRSDSLRQFCDSSNSSGLSLDNAVDACLDALTDVTRRAAGLKAFGQVADGESDSGVEVD